MVIKDGIREKTAVLLTLWFLLFLPRPSLFAQSGSAVGTGRGDVIALKADDITLKLAVIGPGDELYFWWGHIGLVAEDKATGQARFFDWGVFSFENENFFVNFAFGRLLYTCAVTRAELNYNFYIHTNRDITLYTLDLPPDRKEAVLRFAENNMLPENRDYAYHHFRDNCATRIRDILDVALEGRFRAEYGNAPGRFTLRQHVRRHTWHSPLFDWLLNFLMGQGIDGPITVWDDMFLPSEIALRAGEFSYAAPDGGVKKLVSSVEVVNRAAGRPAVLDVPRRQWPRELVFSLLFSGVIVLSFVLKGKERGYRVFTGILQSLLGLFFGAAGSVLFFMTFFTNHDYTFRNSNILFVNPPLLAAIPLGLIFAFTKKERKRFICIQVSRALWVYVVLGGLLTMLIKLSPSFYQRNQVDQALVLPLALTMVFLLFTLGRLCFTGGRKE